VVNSTREEVLVQQLFEKTEMTQAETGSWAYMLCHAPSASLSKLPGGKKDDN
jgi:hypothetical protein